MPQMTEKDHTVQHFLDLIKKSRKGKFKIYVGMSAGVGKTYRMLQEAHTLLKNGIDVKIGYIETHQRNETQALLDGCLLYTSDAADDLHCVDLGCRRLIKQKK